MINPLHAHDKMAQEANMAAQPNQAIFETHEDLQVVLNDLARADTQARALVDGLDNAQINWQPSGNAWSIAQCLDHLAKVNTIYTSALRSAILNVNPGSVRRRGPIRPGWFSRYFIKSMDAPPNKKFRSPKKAIPSSSMNREEVLPGFLLSHDAIRSLISECSEIDLNKVRFRNPFIGILRFTVGTGLLVMMAHDRRHLWQATEIRSALDSRSQGAASASH
jgi:hypothetical protein